MVQVSKKQISDLKCYWSDYSYTATLGSNNTTLPVGFKDSTITKSSIGSPYDPPVRGFVIGGYVKIRALSGQGLSTSDSIIFGRLIESTPGVFSISYKSMVAGVETNTNLPGTGSLVVKILFPEVMTFDEVPNDRNVFDGMNVATNPLLTSSDLSKLNELTKSHSELDNLNSDDHTQYYNQSRGDSRYSLKSESSVSPDDNKLMKRGTDGHGELSYLDLATISEEKPSIGDLRVNNDFKISTKVGIRDISLFSSHLDSYGRRGVFVGDIFSESIWFTCNTRLSSVVPYVDDDGTYTRLNLFDLSQTQFAIDLDGTTAVSGQRFRVDLYGIAINKALTNHGQIRTLDGDIIVMGSSTDAGVNTAIVGGKINGSDHNVLIGRSEAPSGVGLPGPSDPATNAYISATTSVVLQNGIIDKVIVGSDDTNVIGDFIVNTGVVNSDGKRYLKHNDDGMVLLNSSLSATPKSWTASGGTLIIDCSMSNVHIITGSNVDTTIELVNTGLGTEYTLLFKGDGGDYSYIATLSSSWFDTMYGPYSVLPTINVGPTDAVYMKCLSLANNGKVYIISGSVS